MLAEAIEMLLSQACSQEVSFTMKMNVSCISNNVVPFSLCQSARRRDSTLANVTHPVATLETVVIA